MTSYTTTQLATRVLKDVGLIGADETPSSIDLNWSIETCQAEIELLASKGVPIWNGSQFDVPLNYYTALSRRIGLAVAPSFGLIDLATAAGAMRQAEDDLRILGQKPATGEVLTAEYF